MGLSSSSKQNDSKASDYASQATAYLAPKKYSDPFGSFKNGTFTPNLSGDQKAGMSAADTGMLSAINSLPKAYDVNSAYNNPFYSEMASMFRRPIDTQRARDYEEMNNELAARNQFGGSYDALRHQKFDETYGNLYADAESRARMGSADAYNTSISQALQALAGLGNYKTSAMQQTYMPFNAAMQYQSAMTPLQQAAAGTYSNLASSYAQKAPTPTMFGEIMNYQLQQMQAAAQAASAIAGA